MLSARVRSQRGFSLLELMVVTIILGLLMGAVMPALSSMTRRAKNSRLKYNARVVQSIAEGFKLDHNGSIPSSREEMCASATFTLLQNPYVPSASGLNGLVSAGSNTCPQYDSTSTQAPVFITNSYQTSQGSNPTFNGVVYYVVYQKTTDPSGCGAADDKGGIHDNCANNLTGDTNLPGYDLYTIVPMGQEDISGNTYVQVSTPLQNW